MIDFMNGALFVVGPPPEAIGEMQVITSGSNAEYGRAAGGVININLKSGTNELHGSLWEVLQNDKLNSNSWTYNRVSGAPAEIWINDSPGSSHWLDFELEGAKSNRDGIGARIKVVTRGVTQYNRVLFSFSYASSSAGPHHFGLGPADSADLVEIRWPWGTVQVEKRSRRPGRESKRARTSTMSRQRRIALAFAAWLLWSCKAPAQRSGEADLRQGLIALEKGDLSGARGLLEKTAKLDPQNGVVWVALAQTYLRSGQKDLAQQAAERAERFGGEFPPVQHTLALFYVGVGDSPRAAEWERRYAGASGAAALSLSAGQPDEAVKWAQAALRRQVGPETRHLLGKAYQGAGRLEAALPELRAAAKAAPDEELFLSDCGQALLHAKALAASLVPDEVAIEKKLRQSILLNDSYWESHLELGVLLLRQAKYPEAARTLSRSIELNPRNAGAHYQLARVYQRLGKPDLAQAERAEYERLKGAEDAAGLP